MRERHRWRLRAAKSPTHRVVPYTTCSGGLIRLHHQGEVAVLCVGVSEFFVGSAGCGIKGVTAGENGREDRRSKRKGGEAKPLSQIHFW